MTIVDPLQDVEDLLSSCVEVADAAAVEILRFYKLGNASVSLKSNSSPVSQADLVSHMLIMGALKNLCPGIPVISEEDVTREVLPGPDFWLVDPLDGTREFILGCAEFTINIALVRNLVPVLGVVCVPALDICYKAFKGGVAQRRNESGHWQAIGTKGPEASGETILVSRDHGYAEAVQWAKQNYRKSRIVEMGSSLKICLIAEGKAHFYPRFAPTRQWDTAAGEVILKAAGGALLKLDGEPIVYDGLNLKNPNFIAQWMGPFGQ